MQDNFHRPDDHEAKMARADLFKCAQYSFKLFKMISEDQELEGWVQAKITKAADYIASVYHYMEYEMKISEYGSAIENSDMYSESIRRAFAQKLTEAKKQAVKAKDEMTKKEKALDEERSSTGGEITRSKGVTKHKHNPDRFSDEEHTEPKSQAKSKSAAEKAGDKAADKAQEKDSKAWGKANPGKQTIMKGGVKTTNEGVFGNDEASLAKKSPQLQQLIALRKDPKYQSPQGKAALEARIKKQMDRVSLDKGEVVGADGKPVAVKEGAKPDFLDMDKDGDKKEPMKKAVGDKKKNPFTKVKEQTVSSMNAPHQQDRARKADLDQRAQALSKTDRNFRNEFTKLLDQRGKDSAGPGGTMLAFDRFYSGLEKLLSQYQVKEATAKCNHTAKGKSCPVHGLKECGSMYEGNKFDPLKHVKNPTKGEKDAAKDVKRGSYADRAAMLKSAEKDGRLKG
jgi:hypothetical protein